MKFAWTRQYVASLGEWSNLVDKSQRLTDRSSSGMDTTAEGILGIDVEVASPGDPMKIVGAHLDGVPEDARKRLRDSNASVQDLTPSGSGMTVRVIQEGVSIGLFGSQANARVRVPLESTPSKRNAPTPVLTGSEGMFIIDTCAPASWRQGVWYLRQRLGL